MGIIFIAAAVLVVALIVTLFAFGGSSKGDG
jgi:hypothetical protein